MAVPSRSGRQGRLVRGEGGVPLYVQLKGELLAEIRRGTWRRDARIPSEGELERRFGVSRITVRRAVMELAREGWLEVVQGSGTYVRSSARKRRPAAPKAAAAIQIGVALYGVALREITPQTAPFNHAILRGIESVAEKLSWRIAIVARAQNSILVDNVANGLLNGVIMVTPRVAVADEIAEVERRGLPHVRIHRISEEQDVSYVEYDYHAAARLAVEHLVARGYRKIGLICDPPGTFASDRAIAGYKEGLRTAGIRPTESFFPPAVSPEEPLAYFARLQGRPHALMIFESGVTRKALARFRELGVHIPKDMALICLSGESETPPALSAIIINPSEMGRRAAWALHRLLSGEEKRVQDILQPRLRTGQTTPPKHERVFISST